MAQPTTTKKSSTRTRKPSVKSSPIRYEATPVVVKHGRGLDRQHVADIEQREIDREFREHKASLKHSNKDMIQIVVITVLVTMVCMYLTNRWYGL